jgi:hypothetical protein
MVRGKEVAEWSVLTRGGHPHRMTKAAWTGGTLSS